MSSIWFCSDLHLGHKNILEYEKEARPFRTLEEMHEVLINNWNRVVKKYDTIYVLGDFAFGAHNIEIAKNLNGNKRLILGNHDKYATKLYLEHFLSVHGCLFWNECVLTHIPVHRDQLRHRSKLNLHGHTHSKHVIIHETDTAHGCIDKRYFNCCVDANNLTPISADEIIDRLKGITNEDTIST